jgi:hypothetical protein
LAKDSVEIFNELISFGQGVDSTPKHFCPAIILKAPTVAVAAK